MTKTLRVVAAIVWSLGLFVPSTAFAQHGPGQHGPGSVERQQDQRHRQAPPYDTNSEATFRGPVEDVSAGRSVWSRILGFHTMGLGHGGPQEKQLLLSTDAGPVHVHLGPTSFLAEQKVEIKKGDTLEVTGSPVTVGKSQVVLARLIRKGETLWTLREASGQPLWVAPKEEARGFWTKKRVIFLGIVAAKIATLVLLGSHG